MKKFLLTAVVASLLIFGGSANTTEAATVESLNISGVETQEVSAWPKFRDSLLGRHKHDRQYYGYRNRGDRYYRGHRGAPPPPPPPPRGGRHGRHHHW